MTGNNPLKVFRLRGVAASVFLNETERDGEASTFHKVSVRRSYRDGDEIKHTASLGRDDLPIASLLLGRAWEFILEQEAIRPKDV